MKKFLLGFAASLALASAAAATPTTTCNNAFVGVCNSTQMSNSAIFVTDDGIESQYKYSTLAFSMVAAPTDVVVIQGSATKTLRIRNIRISGVATAAGNMPVQIVRRSTAGTLGSAVLTAITATAMDTKYAPVASATAVVSTVGTANYTTLGTSAGVISVGRLQMPAAGSGVAAVPIYFDYNDQSIVVRGTSDYICINFNGAAIPSGGVVDIEVTVEEDNS